jgi:hypothetical protein
MLLNVIGVSLNIEVLKYCKVWPFYFKGMAMNLTISSTWPLSEMNANIYLVL